MAEFQQWLSTEVGTRNVLTCVPQDFVAYFTTFWRHRHAGSPTDYGLVAAPGSVKCLISTLKMELEKLGRTTRWNPQLH